MMNRNLKKPGSAVLDKALEFMAAFGKDDKKLKVLLTEMKEVQVENENLLSDILSSHKKRVDEELRLEKEWADLKKVRVDFQNQMRFEQARIDTRDLEFEEKRVAQEDKHIVDSRDVRMAIQKNKESLSLLEHGNLQVAKGKKIIEDGARKLAVERQEFNAKRAKLESLLNQLKNIY